MNQAFGNKVRRCIVIFLMTMGIILAAGWIDDPESAVRQIWQPVEVVSERVLVPGGQSVGIRMNVRGVLVVGLEEIETYQAVKSPGYEGGVQIGDTIVSLNGTPVYYAEDVERIVNGTSEEIEIVVLRKNEEIPLTIQPVKSLDDGNYKIGIWVKEKIAGIGTLTFYDPVNNMYAALGHGIYESKTGTLLEADEGQLLPTEVKSLREGEIGKPGEIRGIFYGDEDPLGRVARNSQYGIYSFGDRFEILSETEPVIMATQNQITEGPAVIRTTINGTEVQTFSIHIDKVNPQKSAGSKGIELTVTDKELLSGSGGIVQGMSGSPILQNGRIVGAVTHVFVNDPTRGYGIFIQWMTEEAEAASKSN